MVFPMLNGRHRHMTLAERSDRTPAMRSKGFTLIEMLVVMAIIAVLLTVALPRYFGALDKSKDVVLETNLKVLRSTIDKYYGDKGHYPATLQDLVDAHYLRAVPVDPITESGSSWIEIQSTDPGDSGIADIRSGASGQTHDGRSYVSL